MCFRSHKIGDLFLQTRSQFVYLFTEPNCTTMGQVYSQNAKDCVPTCANPNPACSEKTREGCHCPDGTVLDEIQKKCVPLSKCSKNIYTYMLN